MEEKGQIVLRGIEDNTLISVAISRYNTKLSPRWNARSVMILGSCWLVYLVVSTESSVLGPFFPTEVITSFVVYKLFDVRTLRYII